MVLWLDDMPDHNDDEEELDVEELNVEDIDVDRTEDDEAADTQVAPHHDEQVAADVQAANDEGLSLVDLDAARFTRH